MGERWVLLAHYWNGRWGTMTRVRVKLHLRTVGPLRYIVRMQTGGADPVRLYDGGDLRDAYEVLDRALATDTGWRDLKAASELSAAHVAQQSGERTGGVSA